MGEDVRDEDAGGAELAERGRADEDMNQSAPVVPLALYFVSLTDARIGKPQQHQSHGFYCKNYARAHVPWRSGSGRARPGRTCEREGSSTSDAITRIRNTEGCSMAIDVSIHTQRECNQGRPGVKLITSRGPSSPRRGSAGRSRSHPGGCANHTGERQHQNSRQ